MKHSIIVTVQFGGRAADMELPCRMPVGLLSGRLLSALQAMEPARFSHMHGLWLVHNGQYLPDEAACLLDYGICDGDFLTVTEKKGSFRERG